MHQHAKAEPNRSADGTAIGADACTRSPPTQTQFLLLLLLLCILYLYIYLYISLYRGKRKFYSLQTSPIYTLNKINMNLYVVFHTL